MISDPPPATTAVVAPSQPGAEPKRRGRRAGTKIQKQLSLQQEKFLAAYARYGDVRRAMTAAGYSPRSASSPILACSAVRHRLNQIKTRLQAQANAALPKDTVLRELAAISFSSIGDYFDENGNPLRLNEVSSQAQVAVQSYQRNGPNTSIKLYDKLGALELAMRHLGLLEKETGTGLIVQVTVGTLAPSQLDPILTAKLVEPVGSQPLALPEPVDN
jgi:Terminase small subunit.